MQQKMLLILIAIFLVVSSASAQNFVALIHETTQVLTTECNGSVPLADGTVIRLFWDNDSNGPDGDDPLVTVCTLPPNCLSGPTGSYNYNSFPFNSVQFGLANGQFYTATGFTSVGNTPSPARYYLRICIENIFYESSIINLFVGPQDVEISSWQCFPDSTFSGSGCVARTKNVVVSVEQNLIRLMWPPIKGFPAATFKVFRDSVVTGQFLELAGQTSDTTFVDSSAVIGAGRRNYYHVETSIP
jgi:hypothetical protein